MVGAEPKEAIWKHGWHPSRTVSHLDGPMALRQIYWLGGFKLVWALGLVELAVSLLICS